MPSESKITAESKGNPRIFDGPKLGQQLERLAVDVVKGESTDFMSCWYRAKTGDADLVIWSDSERRIIKYQLCFFGQVVDWNPIHGTRTGLVVEEEIQTAKVGSSSESAAGMDSSRRGSSVGLAAEVAENIRFDRQMQSAVVQQAIEVLCHVPEIVEIDRSTLIFNLKQSHKLHPLARERALRTWAPKVDEINSTRRSTFWGRITKWVLGD